MHIREYQTAARGTSRHITKHSINRAGLQIVCNTFPNKDSRLTGIKSFPMQRLGQALPVEIDLHKTHVGWQFRIETAQPRELGGNSRGVVDLKSGNGTDVREPIDSTVKARTKDRDLADAVVQCLG